MRFSSTALLAVLVPAACAFAPMYQLPTTASTRLYQSTATPTEESLPATEEERKKRKKDERLRMMKSKQFHRQGFKEVREKVEGTMSEQFKSELVEQFKNNNYVIEKDGVKVYLAKVRTVESCDVLY
jgi:4-hydroxy-3-methylbut-2-en-1-yl diphosphate reductase